jgi:hypothetical protein
MNSNPAAGPGPDNAARQPDRRTLTREDLLQPRDICARPRHPDPIVLGDIGGATGGATGGGVVYTRRFRSDLIDEVSKALTGDDVRARMATFARVLVDTLVDERGRPILDAGDEEALFVGAIPARSFEQLGYEVTERGIDEWKAHYLSTRSAQEGS